MDAEKIPAVRESEAMQQLAGPTSDQRESVPAGSTLELPRMSLPGPSGIHRSPWSDAARRDAVGWVQSVHGNRAAQRQIHQQTASRAVQRERHPLAMPSPRGLYPDIAPRVQRSTSGIQRAAEATPPPPSLPPSAALTLEQMKARIDSLNIATLTTTGATTARDEADKKAVKEALSKSLEALLETAIGKQLLDAAEKIPPPVQAAFGILGGVGILGIILASLQARKELPITDSPVIAIPAGNFKLKPQVSFNGPLNSPTDFTLKLALEKEDGPKVGLEYKQTAPTATAPATYQGMVTLTIPLDRPAEKKPGPTETEQNRAKSEKLREELKQFQPHEYVPPSAELVARVKRMRTPELLTALRNQGAGFVERTPGEREQFLKALSLESALRLLTVAVQVIKTEDSGEDEVYVRLPQSGAKTPVKALNKGHSHVFQLPLGTEPSAYAGIGIEVWDEDWPDADDLLVKLTLDVPFSPVTNSTTLDGADYRVKASLE